MSTRWHSHPHARRIPPLRSCILARIVRASSGSPPPARPRRAHSTRPHMSEAATAVLALAELPAPRPRAYARAARPCVRWKVLRFHVCRVLRFERSYSRTQKMTTHCAEVGERRAPGAHGAVMRAPRVAEFRTDTVLQYGCVLTVAVCHSRCLRDSSNAPSRAQIESFRRMRKGEMYAREAEAWR